MTQFSFFKKKHVRLGLLFLGQVQTWFFFFFTFDYFLINTLFFIFQIILYN